MDAKKYIEDFKDYFGYRKDYFPNYSYRTVAGWLDDELKLKMPTDTAAREAEGDAVMLLVSSKDEDAIKAGLQLGDVMLKEISDNAILLPAIEVAAKHLHRLS